MTKPTTPPTDPRQLRARKLGLYGLLSDWTAVADQPWLDDLLQREEAGRQQRSLERRIDASKVGRFKSIADFDFTWPKKIDREQLDDLFSLSWIAASANLILLGPNGVGKTMIAKNLVYQAVVRGATARFVTASEMLNDLVAQEATSALQRRLRRYCSPQVLAVDSCGVPGYVEFVVRNPSRTRNLRPPTPHNHGPSGSSQRLKPLQDRGV